MAIDYDEIKQSFIETSLELLDNSETAVLNLEEEFNINTVADLFRNLHTIKGNSGIFTLPHLTKLAHTFENTLNLMREGRLKPNQDFIDLMLLSIDRLRTMIGFVKDEKNMPSGEDLIEQFNTLSNPQDKSTQENKKKETQTDVSLTEKNNDILSQVKKLSIKIPKKIIEKTKSKNLSLSLVVIDLLSQKFSSINKFENIISQISNNENIISKGHISKFLTPLLKENKLEIDKQVFLYQIILIHKRSIEEILQEFAIETFYVKNIIKSKSQKTQEKLSIQETKNNNEKKNITTKEPIANSENKISHEMNKEAFVKVKLDLLNKLVNLTGETLLARNTLMNLVDSVDNNELSHATKGLSQLISELQANVMKTRLQSLSLIFSKFPRLVRDLSHSLNKKIILEITGEEIELDKTLIDVVTDPIMHIIRNAADHGIETPEERIQAGKPAEGLISLKAVYKGGNINIIVEDDGRGIDVEKIRKLAVEKGLISSEKASNASKQEVLDYLMLPGFSTKTEVTDISGRGVGMDVVSTNLKSIGGSVEIVSKLGEGSIITATVPQTLSIITCLVITANNQRYAIPQENVKVLEKIDFNKFNLVEGHLIYELRDHLLPLLHLGDFFKGIDKIDTEHLKEKIKNSYIVVLKSEKFEYGIIIDTILDPEEIVVKPLGNHFSELDFLSGAAVMGDGKVAMIIDVPGLAGKAKLTSNLTRSNHISSERKKEDLEDSINMNYLMFRVSNQTLAMPIQMLPRIEKFQKENIYDYMGLETLNFNNNVVSIIRLRNILKLKKQNLDNEDDEFVIIYKYQNEYIGLVISEVLQIVDDITGIRIDNDKKKILLGQTIYKEKSIVVIDGLNLAQAIIKRKKNFSQVNIENKEKIVSSKKINDSVNKNLQTVQVNEVSHVSE